MLALRQLIHLPSPVPHRESGVTSECSWVWPKESQQKWPHECYICSCPLMQAVETCVPLLVGHLLDSPHAEVILNTLLEIAGHAPAALRSSLPALARVAERCPGLLGQMARIYSAVGHLNEVSLPEFYFFSISSSSTDLGPSTALWSIGSWTWKTSHFFQALRADSGAKRKGML